MPVLARLVGPVPVANSACWWWSRMAWAGAVCGSPVSSARLSVDFAVEVEGEPQCVQHGGRSDLVGPLAAQAGQHVVDHRGVLVGGRQLVLVCSVGGVGGERAGGFAVKTHGRG